jgi:type I restriction-modification system DNA methylase subunit
MLESMYDAFREHSKDSLTAWDRLIEFIAADHRPRLFYQLNHRFEWLFEDSRLVEKLEQTYKPILMQSDYYDHLGEMYRDSVIAQQKGDSTGFILMPEAAAKTMAEEVIAEDEQPLYIVDPVAGTGRMLMAIHRRVPKAHLFGVESDLRTLRIAYTNLAIHGIRALLLHADRLSHEIDLACDEGRFNWKYCNSWYSCKEKLKPITHSTLKPKNNSSR